MIDFRYHVVSIMAVFLALALGLFIGSTSLRGKAANNIQGQLTSVANENKKLSGQLSDTRSQLSHALAFGRAVEPYVLSDRLAGETVTVVSAPDVDGDVRDAVVEGVEQAGATVTGDVRLQSTLLDPQQDQFLLTLTDQLALPGRTPAAGSGSQRALALLADVLATRPQNATVGAGAVGKVIAAYSDGKLISVNGDDPRPASLVLFLSAAPVANPEASDTAATSLLADFAHDLDRSSTGTVVAGPSAAAADGGLLSVIRDDKALRANVSTVDGAEFPSGVIASVMALAEQTSGKAGSYGVTTDGDQPLPSPSPS